MLLAKLVFLHEHPTVFPFPPHVSLQLDDLRQQQELLIFQLTEQITALETAICELGEEREGYLKLIEELVIKASQ